MPASRSAYRKSAGAYPWSIPCFSFPQAHSFIYANRHSVPAMLLFSFHIRNVLSVLPPVKAMPSHIRRWSTTKHSFLFLTEGLVYDQSRYTLLLVMCPGSFVPTFLSCSVPLFAPNVYDVDQDINGCKPSPSGLIQRLLLSPNYQVSKPLS